LQWQVAVDTKHHLIVTHDVTNVGTERLPASKARGPTSRRKAIARTRRASAVIGIARVTGVERFFNKIKLCRRSVTHDD
jgi:hypothetical protein